MVEEINTENSQKVDDNYNESSTSDIIATLQRQLQVIKNIEKNLQEKKRLDFPICLRPICSIWHKSIVIIVEHGPWLIQRLKREYIYILIK
jgi:hypothetical protein